MDQIRINDLMPEDLPKQKRDEYLAARNKMERDLAKPEKVHRYATHEAGHLIYLIRTKLVVLPTDAIFHGPTIYCHYDQIQHYSAAVNSRNPRSDEIVDYSKELLNKLALVAAAAGCFEEILLGRDDDTDSAIAGDKFEFLKHCKNALREDGIGFEGLVLWGSARREIANWIQENRSNVDRLVKIAQQIILKECFNQRAIKLSGWGEAIGRQHHALALLLCRLLFEWYDQ